MKSSKNMQKIGVVCLLAMGLISLSAQGSVLYQDDFSDGTHDFVSSYGALAIVDDSAGLGSGNALKFGPSAAYGGMGARFTETTLANVGDSITLSLNLRWDPAPVTGDKPLEDIRVGLFDDADDDKNMGEYDMWGFTNRISQTATNASRIYENGAQNVRVADTSGAYINYNPQVTWGTAAAHQFSMTITRTLTGVTTTVTCDGVLVCNRNSTPILYKFDTIGMKLADVSEAIIYDNILVTRTAPTAWNPDPANGQGLATSGPLAFTVPVNSVLSWSAPDEPNLDPGFTIQYAVYMDPNQTKVATGTGCTYTRAFGAAASFDPTPDMTPGTQYYWRVDTRKKYDYKTDPNTYTGAIWTFKTAPVNTNPIVDAGRSLLTWPARAATGIQLNEPTLIDNEGDATILWTSVPSDASISIVPANVLNPTVTITAAGTPGTPLIYTLTVTASDGVNPPSSDSMEIKVASDACDASKLNTQTPHVRLRGDYNNDCKEDLTDFAGFALEWLDETSETANVWY